MQALHISEISNSRFWTTVGYTGTPDNISFIFSVIIHRISTAVLIINVCRNFGLSIGFMIGKKMERMGCKYRGIATFTNRG